MEIVYELSTQSVQIAPGNFKCQLILPNLCTYITHRFLGKNIQLLVNIDNDC